jgi:hypothetical protein
VTNILTAAEAANVLRVETNNADMLALLPVIDDHIRNATGHDWTQDSAIQPGAKAAARMLLVQWFENPGMVGSSEMPVFGLVAALSQLETIALRYKTFEGSSSAGAISVPGSRAGDTVGSLVGIVGASGDQSSNFEAVITVDDQIQQLSSSDLSAKYYRVYLVPLSTL